MTEYTLLKERFTGDITHALDEYGNPINEITTVAGWLPYWRDDGDYMRPEMHVIDKSTPDYLAPVMRLNEDGRGLKAFKQWAIIDAGYYRQITVPAGVDLVQADLMGHCWFSQGDDATLSEYNDDGVMRPVDGGMSLLVGIDPAGGVDPWAESVAWAEADIFDAHGHVYLSVIDPSPLITVFIGVANTYGFKHVDGYLASVDVTGYTPDIPEPEPTDGWTIGREQYERTYVLMPPGCNEQWPTAAMSATWNDRRFTVGGSADDAGIGPEIRKVLAVNPDEWDDDEGEPGQLAAFFLTYYAGIEYVEIYADNPADLEDALLDYIHGGVIPEPPVEPPTTEEPQYTLRSDSLIGLHSGFTRAMSFPYIEQSGTTIQKFFSAGDAYLAALKAPGIVSVWRKYVGDEQGRIWEKPTIRESARWYLDLYTAEIETARTNMGLTLAQFLARPLTLESLNETIPTFNAPVLEAAVEFDVHFCELVHDRYGGAIHTNLLCGAIGNPHESEVPLLLPAAIMAAKHEDFLGYHAYWTANEDRSFLDEYWAYHAGRWTEWDAYFRSKGVYPRYASGEGGIVYAWDGQSFDSGKGWKACGSFERYLSDIDRYNTRVLAWNAEHGNRCAGLTLFGYGNWGWDNFELGDGEVQLLLNWSKAL